MKNENYLFGNLEVVLLEVFYDCSDSVAEENQDQQIDQP